MAEAWKPKSFSYGESGVDVHVEAEASRTLYEYSQLTSKNRLGRLGEITTLHDDFRGVRYSDVGELPAGTVTYEFADGAGSKPEIARIAGNLRTIYTDLAEASGADAACRGYEPVHLVVHVKVNTLGQDNDRLRQIQELAAGSVDATARLGISISNGELAQDNTMGSLDQFRFELAGMMTGYSHE